MNGVSDMDMIRSGYSPPPPLRGSISRRDVCVKRAETRGGITAADYGRPASAAWSQPSPLPWDQASASAAAPHPPGPTAPAPAPPHTKTLHV